SAEGAFKNVNFNDYTIRYILQVYYNNEPSQERLVKYSDDNSVAFDVRLVPGRDYNFVVWADIVEGNNYVDNQWSNDDDLHYNTTNLHNITLKQTWVAMDETRDAFTGYYNTADHNVKYSSSLPINITLKRPFAKLRVVTTDMVALNNLGIAPYKATVTYANKHRESFNAYDGTYGELTKQNVSLTYKIASYDDNSDTNKVLFTDYFFAAENDIVKFDLDVYEQNNAKIGETVAFNTDIPVNANYLTTIKGNILTDGKNFNVTIYDAFDVPSVEVEGDIKDQLKDAANFETYVIDLEGDLVWETGGGHGSTPLIPEGAATKTLTINANGYKVIATGAGVGAIRMANGGKLIFNNATIVDQTESYNEGAWELGYLEVAGKLEFNNCVIDNTISIDGEEAVFNSCTFNDKVYKGTAGNEYAAWVSNGKVTFKDCSFSGARGIKVHEAYGSEVKEVIVNNCTFNNLSNKPGMAIGTLNTATKIEIKNSTFTNCQPGDQGLYMYETDTDVTTFDFSQTGNTVNAVVESSEVFAKVMKADFHTLNISLNADVTVDVNANMADYYFGGNNTNVITINGAKVSTAAATGAGNNAYTLTFNHKNSDWNYIRFNNDNAKWVIKNVKLTNSGNNNGPWNRHDIRFYNDVVLENVTSDKAIALLADADLTNVVISDVHPNNSEAYALWITAEGQTVNIKDCALLAHESKTTDRGIKIDNQYINEGEAKVTLNIDGLKVKSQKKAAIVVKSTKGADINIKNIDITEVAADKANAVWVDSSAAGYAALVNVTGASMFTEGAEIIEGNDKLNGQVIENNSVVYLGEGEYVIPAAAQGKTVKFVGTGAPEDTKVAVTKVGTGGENCDYGLDGSTVTFENITITTNSSTYIGYARCNGTYKNCIINGTYTLYGDSVFEDCTFNVSGDVYNIWTWGAPTATFTRCTFNCDGKAMLLYGQANTKLTMNNCVFNDNGSISGKAAIEIGNDYNTSYELTVNKATVNGFDINPKGFVTGTTLWANKNSMPADKLKVTVDGYTWVANGLSKKDGEYYVTNANGLAVLNTMMLNKTAGKGIVVNLSENIDFAGKTWTPVDSHADTAFTFKELNGNGHTISNLTINGQAMFTRFAGLGDVTVKDVTFYNATVNSTSINTSILTVQTYQNVLLDNVDVKNSSINGGYKVAPLIATVYNESSSTITATLKNCDVENVTVKATSYDFCTTGMVAFVYAADNDTIEFENCTVKDVKLMAPNDSYKAHAAIYTTGSDSLYNEAEGVTVTNVTFEAL
ncbi:MAG: hypothetical protein IIV55_00165, partial [Alistipes sp.]|nr:hypothetical protein [Alistipes sp.]